MSCVRTWLEIPFFSPPTPSASLTPTDLGSSLKVELFHFVLIHKVVTIHRYNVEVLLRNKDLGQIQGAQGTTDKAGSPSARRVSAREEIRAIAWREAEAVRACDGPATRLYAPAWTQAWSVRGWDDVQRGAKKHSCAGGRNFGERGRGAVHQ
jgi:hypothetical protein